MYVDLFSEASPTLAACKASAQRFYRVDIADEPVSADLTQPSNQFGDQALTAAAESARIKP